MESTLRTLRERIRGYDVLHCTRGPHADFRHLCVLLVLGRIVLIEAQNVIRLEISMDHAFLVGVPDTVRDAYSADRDRSIR